MAPLQISDLSKEIYVNLLSFLLALNFFHTRYVYHSEKMSSAKKVAQLLEQARHFASYQIPRRMGYYLYISDQIFRFEEVNERFFICFFDR